MMIRNLARSTGGAAILEFAILAPLLIGMLVGLIEFGRAYWVRQTLTEVAFQTARCMALDERCATEAERRAFAIDRARDYAIPLEPSALVTRSGVVCRGQSNSHEVAISNPFSSPIAGFGFLPARLETSSCFPVFTGNSEPPAP
jgi:Flp pilus assembly protein TadG